VTVFFFFLAEEPGTNAISPARASGRMIAIRWYRLLNIKLSSRVVLLVETALAVVCLKKGAGVTVKAIIPFHFQNGAIVWYWLTVV
jgi:hypothetical protein